MVPAAGTGSMDNTGSAGTAGTMAEDTLPDADEHTQEDESQGQEKEPDKQLPAENGNKIDGGRRQRCQQAIPVMTSARIPTVTRI